MKDLYLDKSDYIVVKKSTQCGVSEWLLIIVFMNMKNGINIFYVLPTDILKNRFVHNRYDRSVEFTRYYQQFLHSEDFQRSASVSLKHFGRGSTAFVGSNSAVPFTEFPADWLIIDELDRCDQKNIEMGIERMSASQNRRQIKVSNPTISNFGIDVEYKDSDRKIWTNSCDLCGHEFQQDFFVNVLDEVGDDTYVVIDRDYDGSNSIRAICRKCGQPYDRFALGTWIPERPHAHSGYHISKMFAGTVTMNEMVDRFNKGLTNDTIMQRFYNADLGLAYVAKGSKIDTLMLDECIHDYLMPTGLKSGIAIMGADVGKKEIFVRINEVLVNGKLRAVYIGIVHDEPEVAELYRRYRVRVGVIDAGPEYRMSIRLSKKLKGMFVCYFGGEKTEAVVYEKKEITVPRTPSLDAVKEMIMLKNLALPANARSIPDYYDQMTASTRVFDEEKERYTWDEGNAADHFFLAECYCLLARRVMIQAISSTPKESYEETETA